MFSLKMMLVHSMVFTSLFYFFFGCFPEKHSPQENEEINIPESVRLSDEEYENYLHSKNPDLDKEIELMEKRLKKNLGVHEERFPSPPPGWSLEGSLAKTDSRPKIYRWVDEDGSIRITKDRPPDGAKILGWRYIPDPTPSPTAKQN